MSGNAARPRVRIIHESNPTKYFPAVLHLERSGAIEISGLHRYSVVKEWMRAWLRSRVPFRERSLNAIQDLGLLFKTARISGETVILGFAPWDWRLLKFKRLTGKNRVIYHTSWPIWGSDDVPRQYGAFTPVAKRMWERFIRDPRVVVVTVLAAGAHELRDRYGVRAVVIPHAVSTDFFASRQLREPGPIRLIHVGELTPAKGVLQVVELMKRLGAEGVPVTLTVIGDGPLRSLVEGAADDDRIRYLGHVSDRERLAHEMGSHDLLLVLSQRTQGWEELFSIVAAEAMAAGIGVLASDHIGPHALLAHAGLSNLFEDGDLVGVAARIREFSTEPAQLDEFKAAHRALASAFEIDQVSQAWLEVLFAEVD